MHYSFAIHANYDTSSPPIGYIDFQEGITEEEIKDCALIPMLMKKDEDTADIHSFGMVDRESVDTRPWSELGL